MKTIAVSESAYRRLSTWKTGKKDSFSKVIERMVPLKGTFGSALKSAECLPDFDEKEFEKLEESIRAARQPISDSWK